MNLNKIPQVWPMPRHPRPIVVIGGGAIVRSCHLPAYREAGFPVAGVLSAHLSSAERTARQFKIPNVFSSLAQAARFPGAVFDIAVPAETIPKVLGAFPKGSCILLQKPMGVDLASARYILGVCRKRKYTLAVNFQLRYSPNMMVLKNLLKRGHLGRITDVEVRVNLYTPWKQWTFLEGIPRLEILYHSIHYLDLIRSILGEPKDVYCRTYLDPQLPRTFKDAAQSSILNYGPTLRCSVYTNHDFTRGPRHTSVQLKVEGLKGAAVAHMQQKLNSPEDARGHDRLEVSLGKNGWKNVRLKGDWFPDAFQGTMANLQRYAAGEDKVLYTGAEDVIKTMALVEALYVSARGKGTPIPKT